MEELNNEFVVYGDSAIQMFAWLCPYIERAGYRWIQLPVINSDTNTPVFGAKRIKIEKETVPPPPHTM